ncbi:MAG: hypothetical protein RIQ71_269 [Verrucomicrobiota bacterium]
MGKSRRNSHALQPINQGAVRAVYEFALDLRGRKYYETFFRSCFVSALRRFDSTKRRFVALERFALRRRFLEASARLDCRLAAAADSSLAASKRTASARLRAWDLDALTRTESPVGKWRSVTAVETLLTCWPPGPLDRQKTSSTSCGRHGCIPRPSCRIGLRTSPGLMRSAKSSGANVAQDPAGSFPTAQHCAVRRGGVIDRSGLAREVNSSGQSLGQGPPIAWTGAYC